MLDFFCLKFGINKNINIFVCKLIHKNMTKNRKKSEPTNEISVVLLNNFSDDEKIAIQMLKDEFKEKAASKAIKQMLRKVYIDYLKVGA